MQIANENASQTSKKRPRKAPVVPPMSTYLRSTAHDQEQDYSAALRLAHMPPPTVGPEPEPTSVKPEGAEANSPPAPDSAATSAGKLDPAVQSHVLRKAHFATHMAGSLEDPDLRAGGVRAFLDEHVADAGGPKDSVLVSTIELGEFLLFSFARLMNAAMKSTGEAQHLGVTTATRVSSQYLKTVTAIDTLRASEEKRERRAVGDAAARQPKSSPSQERDSGDGAEK